VSAAGVVAVVAVGGLVCPLLIALAMVVVPAAWARVLPALSRISFLLALPLAASVVIVNVLFTSSGTIVVDIGPIRVTDAGVALAAEVLVRILSMAGAVTLFYMTTRPAELVASLQEHGLSARLTFIIHNSVAMIPRLAERAEEVTAAQRARGLDSEGSLLRRARGVTALAGPTVWGAIAEAEVRTLAVQTRAFTRPGPRTQLWWSPDSGRQRAARWSIAGGLILVVVLRAAGALPC